MYYLEIAANTCTCNVVINGLGVGDLNATKIGSFSYPCNTELAGKENSVKVEVRPVSLDMSTFNKIQVTGQIKRYAEGEFTGPEAGELVGSFSLSETIAMIKENPFVNVADMVPFQLSAEFDSEGEPSFRERLYLSDTIIDTSALIRWAMQFRAMLEQRDVSALYEMYMPKLTDYDIAYPNDMEPDNFRWFSDWMEEKIFPQTPFTDFTEDDITLKKWCDGRIWEIALKDGGPLWRTKGYEGKRSSVEVYVGLVDNTIRIVR